MTAVAVGQAFLSASVQTLLDMIASREFRHFMKNRKLNVSLLDQLEATLLMLGAVLNDAEEKELRSMSEVHMDSLANLQRFHLENVPQLESLPEGGLPSNLLKFTIKGCIGLSSIPIQDWGFQQLSSLSEFYFSKDGSESILHNLLKNQLLPSSLEHIIIYDISNLKTLEGKGLQHLTSLRELRIVNCPNLESLPEDTLPSSLLILNIFYCPKLEERYDYERGKHLSKISHIPTIRINGECYDP